MSGRVESRSQATPRQNHPTPYGDLLFAWGLVSRIRWWELVLRPEAGPATSTEHLGEQGLCALI